MKTCVCIKCGHKWIPRVEKPVQCPACKKYGWKEKGIALFYKTAREYLKTGTVFITY